MKCTCRRGYMPSNDGDVDHCDNEDCTNRRPRMTKQPTPEELHPLAMAVIKAHKDVQGAATPKNDRPWKATAWFQDNPTDDNFKSFHHGVSTPICNVEIGYTDRRTDPITTAIASDNNAMPAFIAIAKGQLEFHYKWHNINKQAFPKLGDEFDENAQEHHTICTQLASIPGLSSVQALREALK